MTITLAGLPAQVQTNYGILSGLQPTYPTPFRDLFMSAPMLAGTKSQTIEFSYMIRNVKAAELMKKKGITGIKKIKDNYWRKVVIETGELSAAQSLTADEITLLQPGGNAVWMVGGEMIPTTNQLAQQKIQLMLDAIAIRENIMCTQLINTGIVTSSDGDDTWTFGIPAAQAKTYSDAASFLVMVKDIIQDYRKATGKLPNRFLIGSDIVDKMLIDTALQTTMYNLGMTNIGRDMTSDEKALVIGHFMGQNLQQMDLSFDENGVNIIAGNVIKLLDTSQFRKGQAPIQIINPSTELPDIFLGDYFADTQVDDKKNASAEMFLKSGFFPVVIDPVSIQTYTVTIS